MPEVVKLKLEIKGAVQGVGFRPFVYRLARELGVAGWVINDGRGVLLEVEGDRRQLEAFRSRVAGETPPRAVVMSIAASWLEAEGFSDFAIRQSDGSGQPTVVVLPDVATCDECLAEVLDADDRRSGYPFTNCTNCGPRFSIVEELPYDRPNTSMRTFRMCSACQAEYDDPLNRRFHAQPNACAVCGPRLSLTLATGEILAQEHAALLEAVGRLESGEIVALKGLGGFLLLVDACREDAVSELRQRKRRFEKPLAVMVPDVATARKLCVVPSAAAELLTSPEAPIVLLDRCEQTDGGSRIAESVAPANPRLGVMLPYTPLHHLLLRTFGGPLVATSGNVSEEPIAIGNGEARSRLGQIADAFLVHDRPIVRHVDDSVVQLVDGAVQLLRRARGYAPLPIPTLAAQPSILAVGGHLKNAAALSIGDTVFLSQHIGDMETPEARAAFERVIADFLSLYETRPDALACDLHPDYPTSGWAEDRVETGREDSADKLSALVGLPLVKVQHHHAHLASCLAEHRLDEPVLGVTWDGTGYGEDGTVWGGEFLLGDARSFERVAALRPFRLPGGDAAVKAPRRLALALLWLIRGDEAFEGGEGPAALASADEIRTLKSMLEKSFRTPITTSAGRLFDAAASLLGVKQDVAFEGQAAMMLESVADGSERGSYPMPLVAWKGLTTPGDGAPQLMLDWQPLVEAMEEDSRRGREVSMIAARFHNALAEGVVKVALEIGREKVVLTGGCFQNRLLSERVGDKLRAEGFEVLSHRIVPANDGGLSLGQVAVAAAAIA